MTSSVIGTQSDTMNEWSPDPALSLSNQLREAPPFGAGRPAPYSKVGHKNNGASYGLEWRR
jgi:hypothetical protein